MGTLRFAYLVKRIVDLSGKRIFNRSSNWPIYQIYLTIHILDKNKITFISGKSKNVMGFYGYMSFRYSSPDPMSRCDSLRWDFFEKRHQRFLL